jgi:hypothetical protein
VADDSLIEEMRAQIRGDRERAEKRWRRERQAALAVQYAPWPRDTLLPDQAEQPAVVNAPEPEAVRVGRRRWLRRRRHR